MGYIYAQHHLVWYYCKSVTYHRTNYVTGYLLSVWLFFSCKMTSWELMLITNDNSETKLYPNFVLPIAEL